MCACHLVKKTRTESPTDISEIKNIISREYRLIGAICKRICKDSSKNGAALFVRFVDYIYARMSVKCGVSVSSEWRTARGIALIHDDNARAWNRTFVYCPERSGNVCNCGIIRYMHVLAEAEAESARHSTLVSVSRGKLLRHYARYISRNAHKDFFDAITPLYIALARDQNHLSKVIEDAIEIQKRVLNKYHVYRPHYHPALCNWTTPDDLKSRFPVLDTITPMINLASYPMIYVEAALKYCNPDAIPKYLIDSNCIDIAFARELYNKNNIIDDQIQYERARYMPILLGHKYDPACQLHWLIFPRDLLKIVLCYAFEWPL